MAYPDKYTRGYGFASYQESHPQSPLPGSQVDVEFDAAAKSTAAITAFLQKFARSDGRLANGSVGVDQLAPDLTIGFKAPTTWEPSVLYSLGATVFYLSGFYNCTTAHTSGSSFNPDYWDLILDFGSSANAAAASAAAAAASETAAGVSETNAATSETNAAASEEAARASEANAAESETNAATSESNAAASKEAAAVSETNAAASETNAAGSASSAAAAVLAYGVYASQYESLPLADAAAVTTAKPLIVDHNVSLAADTTLSAREVQFQGGTITRGSYDLTISGSVNAGDVAIFDKAGTGTVTIAKGKVNVAWFEPTADGAADDSNPFNLAFAAGPREVRVPAGSYACNATIASARHIIGDGPRSTLIRPYDFDVAAWTYTDTFAGWAMAMHIENIAFDSATVGSGIGFAFAKTNVADYASNDEFVGRVKFSNSFFTLLEKGVQRTFGNIGLYLDNTSFQSCTYGSYSLNCKPGSIMHAGNFYCRGGETSGCHVGHYFHNGTCDGFGAVVFDGHILEQNWIAVYGYTNTPPMISPFSFSNVWLESNGLKCTGAPSTVQVDTWSGTDVLAGPRDTHTMSFEGKNIDVTFEDSGVVGDVFLGAAHSRVIVSRSRYEDIDGYGGLPFVIYDPITSEIRLRDFVTNNGAAQLSGLLVDGPWRANTFDISQGLFRSCSHFARPFTSITALTGTGQSNTCADISSNKCDLSGSLTIAPSAGTGNGSLYADTAVYSFDTNGAQTSGLAGSNMALSVGWWVGAFEVKVTAGAPHFRLWDRSINTLGNWIVPADSLWHRCICVGQVVSGTPSNILDVTGGTSSDVTQTYELRNFMKWRFDTMQDAMEAALSGVYFS